MAVGRSLDLRPLERLNPLNFHKISVWRHRIRHGYHCIVAPWTPPRPSRLRRGSGGERRTRAATDERPEPRAKPRSDRRRKQTRCLRGRTWNQEFMAHGEGEPLRSVKKVGVFSTRHTRPGQSTGVGGCARTSSEAVRTRGQGCLGAVALALSTLRLTALAKRRAGLRSGRAF